MTTTTGLNQAVENLFYFYFDNMKRSNTNQELLAYCREEAVNSSYDSLKRKTLENGNVELTLVNIVEISKNQSKSGNTESIEIKKTEIWTVNEDGELVEMISENYV